CLQRITWPQYSF
nr:immunoglobulin light chain junction region [Macaca mulatta]MOX57823.1 immunoglobulin light chain junction region [Macaca mulatta]